MDLTPLGHVDASNPPSNPSLNLPVENNQYSSMNVSSGITSSSSGMNVSTLSTPSIYAHPQTAPPLSSAPMPRRFPGQHGFVHPSTMGPPRPTFNPEKPMKELKVEDALLYLDQVKQQFGDQPMIYNQFLDVMKNFKSQAIDTPGVINRVSTLFKGYPQLILGFNTFLPPGFKIRPDSTYEYQTGGYEGTTVVSAIHTDDSAIREEPKRRAMPPGPKFPPKPKINGSSLAPRQVGGLNSRPPPLDVRQHESPRPSTPLQQAPPPASAEAATAPGQPVEFDHAITYVTTIKKRFSEEPETYKAFLEILHTYQKEQRSIKEVLEQVSFLFRDHPDLLREFTYFLPDAAQHEAKIKLNHEADKAVERKKAQKRKEKKELSMMKSGKSGRGKDHATFNLDKSGNRYSEKRSKKKIYEEKERRDRFALEETSVLPSEWNFFERARKALPTRDSWREFLKCLDLYSQEVIGHNELVTLVSNLFGRHNDLIRDFKKMLEEHGAKDSQNDTWFSMPLAEIDFSKCRRCTPSYRALPASYPNPPCSIRSDLEKDVCNDAWVSVPTGSEDFSFKNMRKNQYEEALFKCEDERFEIDMVIDANACTIRILEPLAKEIVLLRDKEDGVEAQWQYRIDKRTLGTIHINAIARVYGDSGNDILELLRKHPAGAIPIIVERLKQKDAEWRRARQDLNKQWKEVNEKNFHKSLDHCSFYFKQHDKKQISTKGLVTEAKTKREETLENDKEASAPLNADADWKPHSTHEFAEPTIHRIAFAMLQYAAEHNVNSADKERLAALWKTTLLPFLNIPFEWVSTKPKWVPAPSTAETALPPGTEIKSQYGEGTIEGFLENGNYVVSLSYGRAFLQPEAVQVQEKDFFPPTVCLSDDVKYIAKEKVDALSSEHVSIMYEGQSVYVFFRLYHMLHLRLLEGKRLCERAKRNQTEASFNPAARALQHGRHTEQDGKEQVGDFDAFLSYVYALLDGSIDNARYEDCCRTLMGSSSFMLFTMDKLVSQMLKQLQNMASDENSAELQRMFTEVSAVPDPIVPSEYFSKVKHAIDGDDIYRMQFHCGVLRATPPTPHTPDTPQGSTETSADKIWTPSPRVRRTDPCPWLVKPKLFMEYLGDLDSGNTEEDGEDGTPVGTPADSHDNVEEEKNNKLDKKRKLSITESTEDMVKKPRREEEMDDDDDDVIEMNDTPEEEEKDEVDMQVE